MRRVVSWSLLQTKIAIAICMIHKEWVGRVFPPINNFEFQHDVRFQKSSHSLSEVSLSIELPLRTT